MNTESPATITAPHDGTGTPVEADGGAIEEGPAMTTEIIFRHKEQRRHDNAKRFLGTPLAANAAFAARAHDIINNSAENLSLLDHLRCDFAVIRDDEVVYPRRLFDDNDAALAEIQAANKRADEQIAAITQAALASFRAEG